MRVGFIVGKDYDYVPEIDDLDIKIPEKFRVDGGIMLDVAIPYYMKFKHPEIDIDVMQEKDISLQRLKKNDVNFLLGIDLINIWHSDKKRYNKVLKIFQNPKSKIFPDWKLQNFVYEKRKYSKFLKKNKIPVADTIYAGKTPNSKYILNKIKKKGWETIIIKPEMSAWSIGFKKFKVDDLIENPNILDKYFKEFKQFPGFLIQEFLHGFVKFHEIKMYYVNGKFAYKIGTKNSAATGEDDVFTNRVSTKLMEKLKKYSEKILKIIPNVKLKGEIIKPVVLRLDYGCCQNNSLDKNKYFLNEIENQAANNFTEFVSFPVFEKLTTAYYKTAKKLAELGFGK